VAGPTFGTLGTLYGSTTSAPAFAVPASVAANDIIVVAAYIDGTTTVTALPSGFAHATGSPRTVAAGSGFGEHSILVAWKRATAGDTGTYTFTLSGSTFVYGNAVRYTGAITSGDPWDATNAADGGAVNISTAPAVSVTTLGADRLLIYVASDHNGDGGTWTPSAGYSQRQGGTNATNCEIADIAQAVAGSSGNVSATTTAAGRMGAWIGALIGTTSAAADLSAPSNTTRVPPPLLFELAARNQASFQEGTTGVANADATLTATAAITGAGTSTKPLDATLTGTATIAAAAASSKPVDAALTSTATLTAAAASTKPVDAALPATATLTPAATVIKPVDAALTGTATITPAATSTKPVDSALTVAATITPAAASTKPVDASRTATASITAAAAVTKPVDATLSATATVTGAAAATKPVDAALTATATITASATIGAVPVTIDAAPTFTATVTPTAASTKPTAPAVTTTAAITAAAFTTKPAAAALAATATVTAAASVTPAIPLITPRPNTGTTSRPGSGITPRPFTGITIQP
jgi:hypothetical protein